VRDEQLYAFVADTRASTAAGIRRRTRWLHQQLRVDSTFDDLCRDLAGTTTAVEVWLTGGRARRGRLCGVGADVLMMRADAMTAYVATRAVTGVRALAPSGDAGDGATGAAVRPGTHLFVDVLADLADARERVVVGTVAPQTYRGVLGGIAQDFIWFDDNARCLRLDAITDVMIEAAS
jgi:small nuclear ribonucleoprotein (snRNP)-like protein